MAKSHFFNTKKMRKNLTKILLLLIAICFKGFCQGGWSEATVDGVRLGDHKASLIPQLIQRFGSPDYSKHDIYYWEEGLRVKFKDEAVIEILGEKLTLLGKTFKRGDSEQKIIRHLGKPTRIMDSDSLPDELVYCYGGCNLSVGILEVKYPFFCSRKIDNFILSYEKDAS